MGFAHGTLLKEQIDALIPETFEWIERQIEQALPYLPEVTKKKRENFKSILIKKKKGNCLFA